VIHIIASIDKFHQSETEMYKKKKKNRKKKQINTVNKLNIVQLPSQILYIIFQHKYYIIPFYCIFYSLHLFIVPRTLIKPYKLQ